MSLTLARSVLTDMLAEAGGQSPIPTRPDSLSDAHKRDKFSHGLDKVSLLKGLSSYILFLDRSGLIMYSAELRARTLPLFSPRHTNRRQDT